ncbi:uncharacterized protein LOC114530060 isoform X2 [Dendronephthya gigantea]|uniref:uncharacterized protein LOC114530060 isoform X2 n=1 Tax=Dendronephthya gigantea TaxID=151771 RepID=UPI00106B4007|nr:uncharacterized protein LOC114530060 isoform X2 [Dendronephthya gigantea]
MYIRLVAMLANECENKLGRPPCDYAIIGLGSVARMEATPYSDLEFAILYSDPAIGDKINYFRVLSYLLHLKVINLGETILPALGIEQLNDFEDPKRNWFYDSETPRGISFDGAMPWASKTPLGRMATKNKPALELIRTPEQMAELQDEETAVKEGYHLADIMSRVALLFGEQALIAEYNERVAEKLNTKSTAVESISEGNSPTVGVNRGIKQLLHDITNYDPYDSFLGLIFNIRSASPWHVISELQNREIIDEFESANVNVCLSIANEIRLKTYFANEGQKEVLSPVPGDAKTAAEQRSNNCNTEQRMDDSPFYPDFDEDVVVRLLSTSFDMQKRCEEFCIKYNKCNEINIRILQNPVSYFSKASLKGHFYFRLQNLPKALEAMESIPEDNKDPGTLYGQALVYLRNEENEKSIEYLEKALEAHFKNEEMSNLHVLQGMSSLAMALLLSGEYEKAKFRLEEAIVKHNEIYGEGSQTIELCFLMRRLASAYSDLGDSALAFETLRKVERIQGSLTYVPDDEKIKTYYVMACSLTAKKQYSESLEYLKKALQLSHKLFGKHNLSIELASIYMGAGVVYERCLLYDEAASWYERSLELFHLIFGKNPCRGKIVCLMQLGKLHSQRLETDKCVESLQNALKEARRFNHDKPYSLHALVLISLGEAMQKAKKFHDSLQHFEGAKEIMSKIPASNGNDGLNAKILYSMGNIYDELGNLSKALRCLQDAFGLYSRYVEEDEARNKNLAMVCMNIACVSQMMGNIIQAKDYFTKAAVFFRKIPLTKPICSCAVANLFRLTLVCEAIGETDEVLKHLEEARDVANAIGFKHVMVLDVLHRLSKKYNNEMGSFDKFKICFEEAVEMANCLPEEYESMPPSLLEVIDVLKT